MADGNEKSVDEPSTSLEDFIANQHAEQMAHRSDDPGENIDDQKLSNFLSRAFSESRRMSNEVEKCRAKLNKVHQELGAQRLSGWCQEHAAEVLTPQQAELVEAASKS